MNPISRETAEHYVWGQACDGWHLVRGESLSVIEERMPPRTAEVRHRHARARQFFYVLEGELTMEVEGREFRLCAGMGVEIAPGDRHQAVNASVEDVRFIVVSQPAGQGDRLSA